jgi:hypothetical protein
MIDGRINSAWLEGADGLGAGTVIEASFERSITLSKILIAPGNQKSLTTFLENPSPAEIRLEIFDGKQWSKPIVRSVERWMAYVHLTVSYKSPAKNVKTVRLTLLKAHRGEKSEDTAISELIFLSEPTGELIEKILK